MALPDLIGAGVGFLLTLAVFSFIWRDNALFRLVMHIFIGVAAAFALAAAWFNVFWPQLLRPLVELLSGSDNAVMRSWQTPDRLVWGISIILFLLLLARLVPRLSAAAAPALALSVGVGAAVTVGGAVIGTLITQVRAAMDPGGLSQLSAQSGQNWIQYLSAALILVGTLATLLTFQFTFRTRSVKQSPAVGKDEYRQTSRLQFYLQPVRWLGKVFIVITLGTVLAGIVSASLAVLVEWVERLLHLVVH